MEAKQKTLYAKIQRVYDKMIEAMRESELGSVQHHGDVQGICLLTTHVNDDLSITTIGRTDYMRLANYLQEQAMKARLREVFGDVEIVHL